MEMRLTPASIFSAANVAIISNRNTSYAGCCRRLFIRRPSFADQLMLLGTEYTEITPQTARTLQEQQLYNIVEELKIAGGLNYMPKVYIINADYMNAFASGFSERSAMVAITAA